MYGIDDIEIKRLVLEYREQGTDALLEAVQKTVSRLIMDYPLRVFFRNADDCSDYYIYVCSSLPRVLKGYRQTRALFTTWFIVVLRNLYLNWLNKSEDKEKIVSLTPQPGRECGPADMANLRLWREREQSERASPGTGPNSFRKWFKAQNPERKLLLGLLFGECDPGNLQSITGNAESAAVLFAEYLSFSRRASLNRERILARLSACQAAIVRLEKSMFWLDRTILEPDEHSRETARIRGKSETWRILLAKWLRRLNRMKYNMPYNWVCRVTGWPVDRINRQLVLIRKELSGVLGMEESK